MNAEGEFQNYNIDTDCTIDNNINSEIDVNALDIGKPTNFTKVEIDNLEKEIEEIMNDDPEILNLKNNFLPKGLVPLEYSFDSNDVAMKPKMEPLIADIEECNVITKEKPNHIKISKALPLDEKIKYMSLFKEFQDVFAWSYENLKSYDTSIIQHKIPIKEDHKPFKQKLRRINPILMPLIEKEIKRMYDAQIIAPIRYLVWVSNLVTTRKKTRQTRLCVDFINLNKVSLKYNYPLPKMDHILHRVVGSSIISLLNGFSGYNQISVQPEDQAKTAITTPRGTFMYLRMPFGLMNVGETF